jgi:hypothetical protein
MFYSPQFACIFLSNPTAGAATLAPRNSLNPHIYIGFNTTHSGTHADSISRAIDRAGTTLHACIKISYHSLFLNQFKYPMRTNRLAIAATDATFLD